MPLGTSSKITWRESIFNISTSVEVGSSISGDDMNLCAKRVFLYTVTPYWSTTFSALECVGRCGYIGVQSTAAEIPSLRLGDCRQTSGRIWQGKVVYRHCPFSHAGDGHQSMFSREGSIWPIISHKDSHPTMDDIPCVQCFDYGTHHMISTRKLDSVGNTETPLLLACVGCRRRLSWRVLAGTKL